MDVWVLVGAAVFDDDEAVVGVGGVKEGGEDDSASGDTEEDEGVDVVGAEDHGEVGAGEGAEAVLGDDDLADAGRGTLARTAASADESVV